MGRTSGTIRGDLDIAQILSEYRQAIRGRNLSVEEIADHMGISGSSLDRMLNPFDHYTLGVQHLISFLHAVGEFTLLDHIERRLGRVAIMVKPTNIPLSGTGMCRFARDVGEAMQTLGASLEDGRITVQEARECRRELTQLLQCITGLLAGLDAIEGQS